eukprot:TRINITY_DN3590_c1_g2_i1.p4 TRINITY_DN3590_c1_g2~~TRINITY_DN3590_c1_g2_i1.p4  ORF type:complete len:153 (-),score=11.54 TRINITY_DN3590_c1_g2_i1:80-538(-)
MRNFEQKVSNNLPEPDIPRLYRPPNMSCLRESDKEFVFEKEMGQKVRVEQSTYKKTGRAGDLTITYGASPRVEESETYYRKRIDSPTFRRFVETINAKKSDRVISPHERRRQKQFTLNILFLGQRVPLIVFIIIGWRDKINNKVQQQIGRHV